MADEVLAPAAARARPAARRAGAARAAPARRSSTSAISASAPADRAAIPAGSVRSSTARQDTSATLLLRRTAASYSALLLSFFSSPGTGLDLDGDGHRRVERRRRVEAERRRRRRAGGDRGDVLRDADRLRAALDLEHDLDVDLVVLALVGEVDGELGVRRRRRSGWPRSVSSVWSPTCDGVDPGAVQAGRGLAAAVAAAAGRQLLAERVGDRGRARATRCPGRNWRLLELLGADVGVAQRRPRSAGSRARCRSRRSVRNSCIAPAISLIALVGRLGVRAERRADLVGDRLRARRGASPSRSGTSAAPRSCRPAWRSASPARTAAPPGPCSRRSASTGRPWLGLRRRSKNGLPTWLSESRTIEATSRL